MNAAQMAQALKEKFGDAITSVTEFRGEHSVTVKLESLKPLMRYCRDEMSFDYLIDVSSVDHIESEPRFEMVYEVYGLGHHQHLRVKSLLYDSSDIDHTGFVFMVGKQGEYLGFLPPGTPAERMVETIRPNVTALSPVLPRTGAL